MYSSAFYKLLEDMDEDERDAAQEAEDNGEQDPELRQMASDMARTATLDLINSVGGAVWMDGGDDGDMGRRAGACELLALVGRCPRLSELKLAQFDFGEVLDDDFESRLPPKLDQILRLTVCNVGNSTLPSPLSALLSRTPNLEDAYFDPPSGIPDTLGRLLPRPHTLRLDSVRQIEDLVEDWRLLLPQASQSLKSLSLSFPMATTTDILPLVLAVPMLDTLALCASGHGALHQPGLLSYLTGNKHLSRLLTTFHMSSTLIQSLPATLVSLRVVMSSQRPTLDAAQLIEGLQAVLARKKNGTPALALVCVGYVRAALQQARDSTDLHIPEQEDPWQLSMLSVVSGASGLTLHEIR
jgi:hypothetical protein